MALLRWASITLGLTFSLVLAGQGSGTLTCKEESNQYQSVRLPSKTKAPKSSQNSFALSSVHRSQHFFSPIASRWQPTRTVTVPTYSSPVVASESARQQRIVIPVGVSHYRPVQYVDSFKHEPLPTSYFDKVLASVANKTGTEPSGGNSTVAASSDINEVKVGGDGDSSQQSSGHAHPPRFIELESSYVPLTIRFPSRATKLNIIPGDSDLVGQDSNRHDSFGRRVVPEKADNSRSLSLDSRVIFGESKHEEPLVLKEGSKASIPNNMQRIIKCIFPDFHFDGEDKVQSAC